MQVKEFISICQGKHIEELFQFLKFPSVSTDPAFKTGILDCANFLNNELKQLGCQKVETLDTPGHPIVYAERILDPSFPTILVYGHYDVQPAKVSDGWDTDPFDPVIKNEKIYARGAADDKGQVWLQLKAIEYFNKYASDDLKVNLKFLYEGEEESGSENLDNFIVENEQMLACDVVLISDTSIIANNVPSISVSKRGLASLEVEVIGPNRDVHSGIYGGVLANPIVVLSQIIATCRNVDGQVTIPGFYDNVQTFSTDQRAAFKQAHDLMTSYKDLAKDMNLSKTVSELGYTGYESTSIRPTFELNGMWGGYMDTGVKTIIPHKATAKVTMRLVENQNPQRILDLAQAHILSQDLQGCHVKVTLGDSAQAYSNSLDSQLYKAGEQAMQNTFGVRPIATLDGGSIPVGESFKRIMGKETLFLGFGLEEDNIHSPNESFGIFNFQKGIETIIEFLKIVSKKGLDIAS
jgi:acetylornithine deacetylase/succinyl-diaminopimelate desuccinylase-like protein